MLLLQDATTSGMRYTFGVGPPLRRQPGALHDSKETCFVFRA